MIQVYILAGAVALGGYMGWRVTTWAYDADYKAQVEEVVKKHDADVKESERIIRASLASEQKTKIVYRTIKEKAHATVDTDCFDADAVRVWNESHSQANATEAGKPADGMRKAADAIKRKIKGDTP
ncbi:MAG: hypothetical protein KAQ89_07305 [Planctomycetes bacterium]|nr:hypothetical protein [Planctomycetota bacterium]